MHKNIDFTYDIGFKYLIKSINTRKYLIVIISELLNMSYDYVKNKIKVVDSEIITERIKERGKISDCIILIDKFIIIIEMNRSYYENYRELKLRYVTSTYNNCFKKGEKYKRKKIILVNINRFKNIKNISEYKLQENFENIYTDAIKIYEISLVEIYKKWYDKFTISKLEKYLLYLYLTSIEEEKIIKKLIKGDEVLMEIEKERKRLEENEEFIWDFDPEYERRLEENMKLEYATKIGMEKGLKKEKINNAKSMKEHGLSIDLISSITGLSKKEISKM